MLSRWGRGVANLLFPIACVLCGKDLPEGVRALCSACRTTFPRWTGLSCRVCGAPLPDGGARCHACRHRRRAFRFCRSFGLYEGSLRKAILLFKYAGREEMADALALCLCEAYYSRPELRRADLVVPVPLHFLKRHSRGFNQSELLAKRFSASVGLPFESKALVRSRWTWAQARLGKEKRKKNVEGAFVVRRSESLVDRRILLIDDVCTTGATLDACAQSLKGAGARTVDVLTVARDVKISFRVQRARGGDLPSRPARPLTGPHGGPFSSHQVGAARRSSSPDPLWR